ncbi:MAG: endonuclease, partial [Cryobacterium sp.]|nr:endonuclease [Cryobacterium sp.]
MNEHQERYDQLLDRVDAAHRRLAAVAAEQALAIDELRRFSEASVSDESLRLGPETSRLSRTTIARRILVSELASQLRLPDRTNENLIGVSTNLIHTLPATFAVLQAGNISYRHAAVLVDQTAGLSDEDTAELERTVL